MKEMVQRENPKVLLIASPNNPTGNGLTPAELDALLAELPVTTIVLVDEAYASFVSTDTDYIKMLVDKYPNLIISRTLSKFYGLPGLRMGFGFMSKELANFGKYSNKYLGYNRISEDIAIAALKSDAHYRNIARLMNESRACFEAGDYALDPDDASGFIIWLDAWNRKTQNTAKSILKSDSDIQEFIDACMISPQKKMIDVLREHAK
mgnify:CR=1 FL=1